MRSPSSMLRRSPGTPRPPSTNHWPTKIDLLRDALTRLGDIEHHTPAGNLRTDLVKELTVFRRGMEDQRLDRALAVLAELIVSVPELADVRDKLVTDGEQAIRRMLAPFLPDTELEAATLMLCGAILHAALMHGKPPSDQIIVAAVDIALRGIDVTTSAPYTSIRPGLCEEPGSARSGCLRTRPRHPRRVMSYRRARSGRPVRFHGGVRLNDWPFQSA